MFLHFLCVGARPGGERVQRERELERAGCWCLRLGGGLAVRYLVGHLLPLTAGSVSRLGYSRLFCKRAPFRERPSDGFLRQTLTQGNGGNGVGHTKDARNLKMPTIGRAPETQLAQYILSTQHSPPHGLHNTWQLVYMDGQFLFSLFIFISNLYSLSSVSNAPTSQVNIRNSTV